ncbi:MAG: alpha/beta hydrolase [Desulfobacterales bacterium]|jgi:alpha-beta hydrolase superfamily lysophospholipase|nr:alpha/beta hydrolase [Desulfobacterales bacterium]
MAASIPLPRTEELTFAADGVALRATLHLPAARRPPVVIGCHGLLSDRRSPKQTALAEACTAQGLAFLRLDHRGCGESEGRPEAAASLAARASDVRHALRLLESRGELGARVGLFGSSMGGAVCLEVAGGRPVAALVTFAAPVRSLPLAPAEPPAGGGRGGMGSVPMEPFDVGARLGRVGRILVVHGDADRLVPPSHAREIFANAQEPKRLILQPGGDHLMSGTHHQREFVREAARWFRRFLLPDLPPPEG